MCPLEAPYNLILEECPINVVPISCICVIKENTQVLGNILYNDLTITDPLRKIFFIVGHRIVGRAPGTGTLINTYFCVDNVSVHSNYGKYGQVDLTFAL